MTLPAAKLPSSVSSLGHPTPEQLGHTLKVPIGQEGIGQREFYVAGIPGQTRDLAFRAVGGEEL